MNVGMYESFMTAHWFNEEAKTVWSDTATLQTWLTVEAELAKAQAELGMIPAEAAATIAAHAHVQQFDLVRLSHDIAFAQHPLTPVLHQFEALCGEPAAGYIHWGATTQNIFDTATSIQMAATHTMIVRHLDESIKTLATLALEHKASVMAGRTHGQHALPTTFGLKVANWLDELDRNGERLKERVVRSFPVCMGGAIGTFSASGALGREVEKRMAQNLGLLASELPARASYDRAADYIQALSLLAGIAQKIAKDVVFMQRTEIGEVAESFHMGKVGSSTMAQKRNPSTALLLISLTRMLRGRLPMALDAVVRMDEGDSSSTNVTDVLMPEIAILAVSIAATLAGLVHGLVIHVDAMRSNLHLTHGLIASEAVMMGLTSQMGRHEAHRLLYEAAQHVQTFGGAFEAAILAHPVFETVAVPEQLSEWLNPERQTGQSEALTEYIVNRVRHRTGD